jgi:glyceraldehyde 3-phosphate dehydrogenase
MAHLLKYDSVHGNMDEEVYSKGNTIHVGKKKIIFVQEKDPEKLPWKKLKIDIVVESTGFFRTYPDCMKHITAGARKVLLSAPWKGDTPISQAIKGVNDKACQSSEIISNGSCTTNSLAPVVMVLQKEVGIESGLLTTIHSYTNDQKLLDLPHPDLRRARAAAINMIPTSSGAAKALVEVFPELDGKMDAHAIRVPTPCGSISDLTFIAKKKTSVEKINAAMKKAANSYLKNVLEYTEEPIVSHDIIGNPHSSIFDASLTQVIGGKLCKVFAWYDNEWGFSNRMIDVIKLMGR